jgi:anti-sigma B factor antagonist
MKNLSILHTNHSPRPGLTLLSLKGQVDTLSAPELELQLDSVLASGRVNLILDLSGVDYISSAGWGILIRRIKQIRREKGDLVLSGMKPEVAEVFDLLEFHSVLKAFPDPDQAAAGAFPS